MPAPKKTPMEAHVAKMKAEGRTVRCTAKGCMGTGHTHKGRKEKDCSVCEGTGYVFPSYQLPRDPAEVAPEIVKDQTAPVCSCPEGGTSSMCPVHSREPVKSKSALRCTCEGKPANFDPQCPIHPIREKAKNQAAPVCSCPDKGINEICLIHGSVPVRTKPCKYCPNCERPEPCTCRPSEKAMAAGDRLLPPINPNRSHLTPCRFIVGDNVRYRPGNEYDVGTVTDVVYNDSLGTYVITADLPRGSFRAPVDRWDFALPSESNPDIAATVGYRETPTHPTLPTFPQKEQSKRIAKVMCWNAKEGHGFVYIRTEKGEAGLYSVYRSTARTFSFSKHVTTAEGVQIRRPYYVNLRNSVSEVQNEGWKTGRPLRAGCTCPGYAGCGYCKHSDALVHLVSNHRFA